jgi:hypothetical protein
MSLDEWLSCAQREMQDLSNKLRSGLSRNSDLWDPVLELLRACERPVRGKIELKSSHFRQKNTLLRCGTSIGNRADFSEMWPLLTKESQV